MYICVNPTLSVAYKHSYTVIYVNLIYMYIFLHVSSIGHGSLIIEVCLPVPHCCPSAHTCAHENYICQLFVTILQMFQTTGNESHFIVRNFTDVFNDMGRLIYRNGLTYPLESSRMYQVKVCICMYMYMYIHMYELQIYP